MSYEVYIDGAAEKVKRNEEKKDGDNKCLIY